jgi:hypothetical protein
MTNLDPVVDLIAAPTSPLAVAPKVDPIVVFYINDANAAVMRAMTVVKEELDRYEHLLITASTLAVAHHLVAITEAITQMLTDVAASTSNMPTHNTNGA